MNIQPSAQWTPAQWYNSHTYKVSYKRIYKSASSTIVDLLGEYTQEHKAQYDNRFTVIREPVERAISIYKELVAMNGPAMNGPAIRGMDFSQYLEYTLTEGYYDKHQFPQSFWVYNIDKINYFTLDNLEEVARWIGAPVSDIKQLNRRQADIEIKPRNIEIIENLYSDDIKLYKKIKKLERWRLPNKAP